jgi:hypothetical protein
MGGGPVAASLWARTDPSTWARRSATPPLVGTSTIIGLTRLPTPDLPPGRRPETGTVITIGSTDSPLLSKSSCKAPPTATRTASFVVAPYRWAADASRARSSLTIAILRRGPVRRTSEQGAAGAGRKPPPADMARRISRHDPAACRTLLKRVNQASRARLEAAGRGRGKEMAAGGDPGSTSATSTFSPPRPSARTWCKTTTTAAEPSASPVIRTTDQSGAWQPDAAPGYRAHGLASAPRRSAPDA